jgi:hypothetical protein
MEILRLIDTTAIQFTTPVPTASAVYTLAYEDLDNGNSYSASATSLANKTVTFTLDDYYLKYTGSIDATVYDSMSHGILNLGIDVVRPYCDLTKVQKELSITNARAVTHEKVARKLIDAELGLDMTFQRKLKEVQGMGLDYLPLHERIHTIYSIKENGTVIYDRDDPDADPYTVSIDKTSIVLGTDENKMESVIVWNGRYSKGTFVDGYDYVIDGDFGYRQIPEDVQEACEMLIQDIESGAMKYSTRGIEEFDNREFKVKYAKGTGSGTGNTIVDKLLSVYKNGINLGVL